MLTKNLSTNKEVTQNPHGITDSNETGTGAQIPQRDLNQLSTDELNQVPSADLNDDHENDYATIREAIEEVNVGEIQPFTRIPDYVEETTSVYPTIVMSTNGCWCVDGFNLVEKEKSENQTTVTCRVFHLRHCSDLEIAIRKVATRILTQGGKASYIEIVVNTHLLHQMFVESMDHPVLYCHGGCRRGVNFLNNREDDIVGVLAYRLGRNRKRVSEYLHHVKYLNEDTKAFLIEKKASKDFFVKAQRKKRVLVKNLKSEGDSEDAIMTKISEAMHGWHQEYEANRGKIKSTHLRSPSPEQSPAPSAVTPSSSAQNRLSSPPKPFKHWDGHDSSTEAQDPTLDQLQTELKNVIARLTAAFSPDMTPGKMENLLREEITVMVELFTKVKYLTAVAVQAESKEAA